MNTNDIGCNPDLIKKIEMAEVISFDFFDTLYVRPLSDPEDAFILLGEKLNIIDFKAKRQLAQIEAFKVMLKDGRKEITLENIYSCFPETQFTKEELMKAEYELEMALIQPNYEIFPLFKKLIESEKKVIIISDMYFSKDFFLEALSKQGIENIEIFSSSDVNATKRDTGEIFDFVAKNLEIEAGKILHIGDCELADYQRSSQKGLSSYHYVASRFRGKKKNVSLCTSIAEGLLRSEARQISYGSYEELGFLIGGPANLGFLEWIREKAQTDSIEHILFFARDGFILTKILDKHMEGEFPSYSYFYGSRTTFTLAAMTESNFSNYIPFLISGSEGLSPCEVLERIGVKVPAPNIMENFGLGAKTIITPALQDKLVQFLYAWRWEILKVCQRNRRGLFQYLAQLGIKNHQKVAVVDVGWSGTTQEAFINAISSFMNLDVYGYYFCLADTPERVRRQSQLKMSALFDSTNSSPDTVAKIYAARVAVEFFFSAPHNSIIGFNPSKRKVLPIEDSGRGVDNNLSIAIKSLCEGGECFIDKYFNIQRHLNLNQNAQLIALPIVEIACINDWREYKLITQFNNFDAWGSSRNKKLKATDYLCNP